MCKIVALYNYTIHLLIIVVVVVNVSELASVNKNSLPTFESFLPDSKRLESEERQKFFNVCYIINYYYNIYLLTDCMYLFNI